MSYTPIMDILIDDICYSGKLPFTIAKAETDYSARVTYTGTEPVQIPYSEGIFIDYRHFDVVRTCPTPPRCFGPEVVC